MAPPRTAELDLQIQSLQAQAARDRRALEALRSLSLSCRGATQYRPIFEAVARELRQVFRFDAFYIAVCDPAKEGHFRAVLMVDEGVHEYCEDEDFGRLTGMVVSSHRPLLFRDLDTERSKFGEAPTTFGHTEKRSRSWLGIPLLVGADSIGVISLQSYEPHLYDEDDTDLLQRFGDVVAVVLENTWLDLQQQALGAALSRQVTERTVELQTLSLIAAELVVQQPLPTLLGHVLDMILPLFHMDAGTVRMYDTVRDELVLLMSRGFSAEYSREAASIPLTETISGIIARENRPLVVEDRLDASTLSYLGPHLPFTSMLGVPLRAGGQVLGSLSMFGHAPHAFAPQVVELAQAVGNQIAIAVENARLFESQKRQIRELNAIGQVGQLISASYDFQEMLDCVQQSVCDLLQPSVFYLLICSPDTKIITHAILLEDGQQLGEAWIGSPPRAGSATAWIFEHAEPLLLQDMQAQMGDLHKRGIFPKPIGTGIESRSWVGVPLRAGGSEPIGVLVLQDYRSYMYDDETVDFLSQIASHLSLGVQKVRLFEERERQLVENARLYEAEQEARRTADTLREVARVLGASFDPREVLELMLRELKNVIAYDSASIMLLDRDILRFAAVQGFDSRLMMREIHIHARVSGAGAVVARREPILIPDVVATKDWMPTPGVPQVIHSWIGVPLISQGRVIGVLNIDSKQIGYFSQRDVDVAQAFANQAAVALENARLYEESITRVEQELEIARHIQSNLFPHVLPQLHGLVVAARCVPARETGGDFFDFVPLAGDRALALFVGDASGKSIPGAMLMAIAHSIVRAESRDRRLPHEVIREANAWISKDVPPRSFVALCYAMLDLDQQRLLISNAGQLTPIRRRADGELFYLETPGPRLPLGILPETRYESLEVAVDHGDLLLMFTDGIVEAQNADHELFGFARLEAILRSYAGDDPHLLIDQITNAITLFCGDVPPHDDMTLLALSIA